MAFFGSGQKESPEMKLVNENIARVEREIQQKIFQLGQMYYDDHKGDSASDDKYYAMIDAITKLDLNRIGFYKNKLRLQGQMICENCGAIIPYGSVFCSACGKKADEKQEGGTQTQGMLSGSKCAKCGAPLEVDSMFCTACGAKVE